MDVYELSTHFNTLFYRHIFSQNIKGTTMKTITMIIALTVALMFAAPAFSGSYKKDIVDTAAGAGSFNTLVTAVQAADLVDTLKGDGPFTVFAPTDEAFAKLPAGTVEDLLKPENKEKLQAVLLYHVVAGRVTAAEVVKLSSAKTASDMNLAIVVDGESVMVNNAKVVQTDIMTSNGVIHVIDTVLIP